MPDLQSDRYLSVSVRCRCQTIHGVRAQTVPASAAVCLRRKHLRCKDWKADGRWNGTAAVEAVEQTCHTKCCESHGTSHAVVDLHTQIERCHGCHCNEGTLNTQCLQEVFCQNAFFGASGFLVQQVASGFSMFTASAGKLSVKRLMNSSCTAVKGRGRPKRDVS